MVELNDAEEKQLQELTSKGKVSARKIKRAQILLMADRRQYTDNEINNVLKVSSSTIYRVKRRLVEDGLDFALEEGQRSGQPRKLNANQEALLVSIACSKPPKGCAGWTLELLTQEFMVLIDGESFL